VLNNQSHTHYGYHLIYKLDTCNKQMVINMSKWWSSY